MLPYRICLIQPWTEAENAYNDDEEARQLRRTERLYEQWGKDWKKVPDIGASFKVRQRMLWEQRREQDRLSLAAIASGSPDPFPHFASQRGVCWCDDCATPEHLLPPQPNNGEAFVDPLSGCWAVPVMVETTWDDLLFENEQHAQYARDESIMRQINMDSVNVTHFRECLAEYWQCDAAKVQGELDAVVRDYVQSRPNKTWEQGVRRLKKEIVRAHLMHYQSKFKDPEAKESWESMMQRPINGATGKRIFNLDYGESSDEEYDGMRCETKPMGVGWHVWNHTLFQELVLNRTRAQKGVFTIDDLFPSCYDYAYSLPDPANPGPRQPLQEGGMLNSPFGGDTEYHLLANKHQVEEVAVRRPGNFPVRYVRGQERQKLVGQQVHFTEFELDAMDQNARDSLAVWRQYARGNSSRPGQFDLTFASPVAEGSPCLVPVIEGGAHHGYVATDSLGSVPALNEQDYLRLLWQRTVRKREQDQTREHTSSEFSAAAAAAGIPPLAEIDLPVSANHPPPIVRKGLTLKWDVASWIRTCMHAGGGWNGSALPVDQSKWPTQDEEVTWKGTVPPSKRLKITPDTASAPDSSFGNPSEEPGIGQGDTSESEEGEEEEAVRQARRERRRRFNAKFKDYDVTHYYEMRTPATTPPGETSTVFNILTEPKPEHPDFDRHYNASASVGELLGYAPVPATGWVDCDNKLV
jgi:hypothetical protein